MKRRGQKKIRTGVVTSDRMEKTITVKVERKYSHPLYKKIVRMHKSLYADDPKGQANVGDTVKIMETRPLSKLKRWRLIEIIKPSHAVKGDQG